MLPSVLMWSFVLAEAEPAMAVRHGSSTDHRDAGVPVTWDRDGLPIPEGLEFEPTTSSGTEPTRVRRIGTNLAGISSPWTGRLHLARCIGQRTNFECSLTIC
jgi:hypothetical protein